MGLCSIAMAIISSGHSFQQSGQITGDILLAPDVELFQYIQLLLSGHDHPVTDFIRTAIATLAVWLIAKGAYGKAGGRHRYVETVRWTRSPPTIFTSVSSCDGHA